MITLRDADRINSSLIDGKESYAQICYQLYPIWCLTGHKLGRLGEKVAARFLSGLEYSILARNWQCKLGEVDLIASFEKQLILFEVKTRCSLVADDYPALAAIDSAKQKKLIQLSHIIWDHRVSLFPKNRFKNIRIDAIAITVHPFLMFGVRSHIQHIPRICNP